MFLVRFVILHVHYQRQCHNLKRNFSKSKKLTYIGCKQDMPTKISEFPENLARNSDTILFNTGI